MRSPVLESSVGLWGGLATAAFLPTTAWRVAAVAVLMLVALGGPRSLRRKRCAFLAFALGVLMAPRTDGGLPEDHVGTYLGDGPTLVSLRGRVLGQTEITRSGLSAFDLSVEGFGAPSRPPVGGIVRVLVRTEGHGGGMPLPGDLVAVVGTARRPRSPTNPGEPDTAAAMRRTGRTHVILAERPSSIRVLDSPKWPDPRRLIARLRDAASRRLAAALPSPESDVAAGLLLGRRSGIPASVEESFRRSGTVHLLAVSGLHVGLMAGALFAFLSVLRCPPRAKLLIILVATIGYAVLAGLRPPVVRAAVLTALVCGGRLLRRRTSILDLLGTAAFLILLSCPSHAGRVDFQLSFAAVLGLVLLTRRISEALFPMREVEMRFAAWHRAHPLKRILRGHVHRILPATWAAWLATAPLVLMRFGTCSPAVLIGNLLLLPLLVLSLGAATVALALGPVSPLISLILAFPLRLLRGTASFVASLPAACIESTLPPLPAVLGAYALLALLALRLRWGRRHLAVATVIPFALILLMLPRTPPRHDRLTMLDVGQGACVLVERATGTVVLHDAGSTTSDVGRRRIEPVLRARRIRRIDALVLSHADADHISGAPHLLRRFDVGLLLVPETFGESTLGRAVLDLARSRGVPVRTAVAGDLIPGAGEVIHPPRGAHLGDNDGSLVVRVTLGPWTALLTGDLEERGVGALLASGSDVRADVLLLPHHGGRNRGIPLLLEASHARILLTSASSTFPSEPLPEGLESWKTSDHGAVTVDMFPDLPRRSGFRQTRQVEPNENR
jgi:competence protein ComEC